MDKYSLMNWGLRRLLTTIKTKKGFQKRMTTQGHLLRTCHQDGAQLCAQLLVYGEAAGVSGGMDASRRLHSEFC